MKTLELFKAVPAKKGGDYKILPEYGIIVEPSASYALNKIKNWAKTNQLTGSQLNKTFHKSWAKVINSTREELFMHQILHYATTYGTGHTSEFIYFPKEENNIPEKNITFLVIRGLSKKEIQEKSLNLLKSGVALKQETIKDLLEVLYDCDYTFTGNEEVTNKEALMYITRETGILPVNPVESLRYLVFLATGQTLLIKNKLTYDNIESCKDKIALFSTIKKLDEKEMAKIFNRFKPIFLSLKKIANESGRKKINKISRLSKILHQPIPYNILNDIGNCTFADLKRQKENLLNANFYQLARCLTFLKHSKIATVKVYNVRNGKSFVKRYKHVNNVRVSNSKINFILGLIKQKYNLKGKKFYIPNDVLYALPTSEKNFVGNIPMGTKFITDEPIASGVYWENKGGAIDIDVSAISCYGKVGWNAAYDNKEVTYSGDVTSAPRGATEYIRACENLNNEYLINCNIYNGATDSKFNIIFGKGSKIDKKYMMNPNKAWFTAPTESLKKESIIGLIYKEKNKNCAIVINLPIKGSRISYSDEISTNFRTALIEKWQNQFSLNELLEKCGAEIVDSTEDADIDLTPSKLEKDSILSIFDNS